MHLAGFIVILLLGTLTSSAQVERKTVTAVKTDSARNVGSENSGAARSRKDRLKDLDLSREQRIKLKEMRDANATAKAAIENNTQLSEPERKKQLRDLQKAQAQKIQSILTPKQIEKFKASKQNNP